MSDRIAVFNRGRIEQVGTPAEVYEHPATRFVAGFVGVSNVIERRRPSAFTVRPEKIRVLEPAERRRAGASARQAWSPTSQYLGPVTRYPSPSTPAATSRCSPRTWTTSSMEVRPWRGAGCACSGAREQTAEIAEREEDRQHERPETARRDRAVARRSWSAASLSSPPAAAATRTSGVGEREDGARLLGRGDPAEGEGARARSTSIAGRATSRRTGSRRSSGRPGARSTSSRRHLRRDGHADAHRATTTASRPRVTRHSASSRASDVAVVNLGLIPNYKNSSPGLKDQPHNTVDGKSLRRARTAGAPTS